MTGDLPDRVTVELDAAELGGPMVVGTLRRNPASGGANPMPEKSQHELAIDEADHGGGIETLLATAAHYRLTTDATHAIVSQVRDAIAGWRAVAKAARVGRAEMEALEDAIDA